MANTQLYTVLSGLHYSDTLLSTTITNLSGKLSPAFTSGGELTIGAANGITKSTYTLPANDSVAANDFGNTANKVASEKNTVTYVNSKIAEANAAAVTGAQFNGPISGTVVQNTSGKQIQIDFKYDNATLSANANNQLYSTLTLVRSAGTSSTYAATYQLKDGAGHVIGDTINIPKDQFLKEVKLGYSTANDNTGAGWTETLSGDAKYPTLKLTFELTKAANAGQTDSTATDTDYSVYVSLNSLVDIYTSGTGITVGSDKKISINFTAASGVARNGATVSGVVKANDQFLAVGADGFYTKGITDAITAATSTAVSATTAFSTTSGILIAAGNGRIAQDSKVTIETTLTNSDSKVPTSKAVSSHVSTVTNKMVTAEAALTSGKLVLGDGNKKVAASTYQISGTLGDVATDIPTSKAVSSFVDTKIQTANAENVTADTEWGNENSGKLVITDGTARKVKVSSYTVTTDEVTASGNTTIPTNTAVKLALDKKVIAPSANVANGIPIFDGANSKTIKDSGKTFTDNAVTSSASGSTSVPTNAAIWKTVSGLVSGTVATVTANDFAMFDGTNGRALKDSTVSLQKSTDTNGTTLADETKIPTAKAISGYIATQTANYVVPSGSGFALDEIAIFADDSGKKIATSNKKINTAAPASNSTDDTIPTSKAVWSAISGYVSGSGLTAEKIVLGNGGQNVKTSSIGILKSTDTGIISDTASSGDTMVPTAGAVAEYVTDGLAALETKINTLNTAIAALN